MGTATKEGGPPLVGKAMALLVILTFLLQAPIGAGDRTPSASAPPRGDLPADAIKAFSGVHRVSDFASTVIYGEELWQRGRLGHFSWSGDVNGDGLNDLVVAAPGAPGVGGFEDEGRIYIFYGKNGSLPKVLDLDQVDPDILIISNNTWFKKPDPALPYPVLAYLTNEFDVGDLDGDGIQDMVMAIPGTDSPVWGAIVFGPEGGFPKRMTVHLQRSSVFSVVQGDLRYEWLSSAFLAPGQDNMVLPNYMMVEDLNRDGADELVVGCDGSVLVRWGGSGSWTEIFGGPFDHFGWALDLGDVNADGEQDLLIGASLANDPVTGSTDCGAAYLIFNLSQYNGLGKIQIRDVARPTIYGSSDKDMFGRNVMLCDVDGDGKDDIVVAAPEADGGPGIIDCGRIYAFRGGANTTFPSRMVSDDDAYWTLIGHLGKYSGENVYPGDRLGSVMEAGDIDGDGLDEIVLGLYSRTSVLSEPVVVDNVGMVMVHEALDLFPTGGAIQRLERTGGSLTIEGDEMRDMLGWQVFVGDVTNDGVDDILVGAPAADGPDNQRTSDGEAYIIQGSNTFIGDLRTSGSGFSEPYLLAGGREVMVDIDFVLTGIGRSATEAALHLSLGPLSSSILVGPEGLISTEGPSGLIPMTGSCGLVQKDGTGSATFAFSTSWDYLNEGVLDLTMTLKDGDRRVFYRDYPKALTLTKDVELIGELLVQNVTGPLSGIGEWVLPGDPLSLSGLRAVYSKVKEVDVPEGSLDLVLKDNAGTVARDGYSTLWSFPIVAQQGPAWDLTIGLELPNGIKNPPEGMEMGGSMPFRVNIDNTAPLRPEDPRARSVNNGLPVYDCEGRFDIFWNGSTGTGLDPGGSGVREFQVLEKGKWRPVIAKGGLIGTYFRGKAYQETAFQRKDASINFTLRDWGPFGPDPSMLMYDDFSVRWHGYLLPEMNGSYLFSLSGSGCAMVKLDGKVVLDKTSILEDVQFSLPFLIEGSVHPLEVYFSNDLDSSYLLLDVWDPAYRQLTREEMPFDHPSNSTRVMLDQGLHHGAMVRSVDWTGRVSETGVAEAHRDDRPPAVVPGWDREWFNSTTPLMKGRIIEPDGMNGSGIDVGSLAYSFEREGITKPDWQTEDIRCTVPEDGQNGPGTVNFTLRPYLEEHWRGTLLLTALDLAGNRGYSDRIWLGIDTVPPVMAMLQPAEGTVQYGTLLNLTVSFSDGSGSGPDPESIELRYTIGSGSWSEWTRVETAAGARPDVFTGQAELRYGRLEVQFRGSDIAGNPSMSVAYIIDMMEPPVNRPPVPNIAHPPNGTRFYTGQIVELSATGTWDDGLGPNEKLALTWYSSRDGWLGEGALLKTKLSLGVHIISLFADDGALGHNKSTAVTIEVMDWSNPPSDDDRPQDTEVIDPLSIFAILALLLVVIVLLIFVIMERRGSRGTAAPEGENVDEGMMHGNEE